MKILLMGGTDIVAITLEWAMLELVRHPNVMQRLQSELDSKLELGQHIEEDLANQLPYFQVKELQDRFISRHVRLGQYIMRWWKLTHVVENHVYLPLR